MTPDSAIQGDVSAHQSYGDGQTEPLPESPIARTTDNLLEQPVYRVYKRRWFGLVQLALLNIVVSWDVSAMLAYNVGRGLTPTVTQWLTFSAISDTSATYFRVSQNAINWLSTGFLFAFCFCSPAALWILNKGGPKPAIVTASGLILIGNWIRYAGTRASDGRFGVVMFGQIVIGLGQPFLLAAPTRYSDLWFTARGRISATAFASLANPFGGALGQLIDPLWVSTPKDVPNMVLYIAIISSICCIPSFFISARPPIPPCPSAGEKKIPLRDTAKIILRSVGFWLLFIPFSVYVGFFNAFSSLINQILKPYGYSEAQAGLSGALLIVVGVLTTAIMSPLVDRNPRRSLTVLKFQVPLLALAFLTFIWIPQARNVAAPYFLCSVLGACAFSLMPIALETLAEATHPVSPEITSVTCWFGGSLLGACFLLIMDALKAGQVANPPYHMTNALIFQGVVALVTVPLPLCLGVFGRPLTSKRLDADDQFALGLGTVHS